MNNQETKEVQEPAKKTATPFALAINSGKSVFVSMYGEKAESKFKSEYGFALMQERKNKALSKCSTESIRNSITQVALTGLTLNPMLQYAHLVPRGGECTLDIDYKGMINIMYDTRLITGVDIGVVFKGEKYEYRTGDDRYFSHTPNLEVEETQENAIAAYVTIDISGSRITYLLKRGEVLDRRDVSKSRNIWNGKFWKSMWIKSAIRYAWKFIPKTENMKNVIEVLNQNEPAEFDKEPKELVYS